MHIENVPFKDGSVSINELRISATHLLIIFKYHIYFERTVVSGMLCISQEVKYIWDIIRMFLIPKINVQCKYFNHRDTQVFLTKSKKFLKYLLLYDTVP